jgi:aminopeptidase-like protein
METILKPPSPVANGQQDPEAMERLLEHLFDRLFPINRSITGDGVRKTLRILDEYAPIRQTEYPTGTVCFDWTVPKEWNVRDAYVKDPQGCKVIDFQKNNLHLMGYSVPFRGRITRDELLARLYTKPDLPDAIPYMTSYYREDWGFCVEHSRLETFTEEWYDVVIDADWKDGSMTIGEGRIQGATDREILLSTYVCHPSMAINELSGPLVQTMVYRALLERQNLKYSYRFLYVPETIGSILYLSKHGDELKEKVDAGYVVTCTGHGESFTYKKSKRGDTLADKAALHVLKQSGKPYRVVDWSPFGSDERQYCSEAFRLPVGSLMRTMYGEYPEYHTSLDNRSLISWKALRETVDMYLAIIDTLEANETYMSTHIHGEPKLDKRGLYPYTSGTRTPEEKMRILQTTHLIAFSDGKHDLMDIAETLGVTGKDLHETALLLVKHGLLRKVGDVEAAG